MRGMAVRIRNLASRRDRSYTGVLEAPVTPDAPANLVATGLASSIGLTWDVSAGATSYKVYRALDGDTPVYYDTTGPNSYEDTGAVANTLYVYEVTAVNSAGESVPSNQDTAEWTSGVGYTPALQFNDARNSMYIPTAAGAY